MPLMIKRPLPVFLLVASLLASPPAVLRAQQTPPLDPKAVLTTLKDLRAKQSGLMNREKADVLAAINAAIADPGKAYEKAMESVELQGETAPPPPAKNGAGPARPPAAGTRILDARKRIGEQVRDHDFVNGLRLQLSYLSLTWQHGMGVKTRDLITPLLDYVGQVNQSLETLQPLDMFRRSLNESVFVGYFQVGPYLNGFADWSDHPFDTASIFQKTILPEMRNNKDPRLLSYWDNLLQTESARVTATQNNLATTKFNHIRRPSLLWSRAEDELILGSTNQGIADMLGIVKANPDHPDFDKWATQLEGIASAKAAPPVADAPPAGPAAPATPAPVVR